jgi:glyoxylase-like metal-dependent hydrolase (beta-lactamase superfamily II)
MEGAFTVDQTKRFVPFRMASDRLDTRPSGSLLVEIQPFVIIMEEDILLMDTGLGYRTAGGTLQIHQNLLDAGINPMDVTKVLMSHLHKDHAGGIASNEPANGGGYALNFPSATYYVQQRELEYALQKGAPSYMPEELLPLQGTDRVVLLDQDTGSIGPHIQFEMTEGHSPFHQVFWIRERGETTFFGGDDAPQWKQMQHKFVAKYDYDGKKCMELRRKWGEEGVREHWTMLFYHDTSFPLMSL